MSNCWLAARASVVAFRALAPRYHHYLDPRLTDGIRYSENWIVMTYSIREDPEGSILEFASLMKACNDVERAAWELANLGKTDYQIWSSQKVSKRHFRLCLERHGRGARQVIDRAFQRLEIAHLLDTLPVDDNPNTELRVISPLGEEVLREKCHREVLFGLPEVVKKWSPSVIKICHPTEQGIGTGFLVTESHVATAAHVIDDLHDEIKLETSDGTILSHAKIHRPPANMPDLDIAIIELTNPIRALKPIRLSSQYQLLDEVVVLGYPPIPFSVAPHLVANRGEVSSMIELRSGLPALIVSCLLRGGNSGGPVLNRRGQAIGIISRNLVQKLPDDEIDLNQGLGFAAAFGTEWIGTQFVQPGN